MAEIDELRKSVEELRKTAEGRVARLVETVEELRRTAEGRVAGILDTVAGRAVFKARLGKAGRIVVPEAERVGLGLEEGDLVQIALTKLERKG